MRVLVSWLAAVAVSWSSLSIIKPCSAQESTAIANERENEVFLWSSTGGGWRSMFACVGYANLFRQANLMGDDSSQFTAIATNSGASWFAAQLFYSQAFYDKTVLAESPEDLYAFTEDWMQSYLNLTDSVSDLVVDRPLLDIIAELANSTEETEDDDTAEILIELAGLFDTFDGDWAQLVGEMLQTAAADYGHEGDLNTTRCNSEGRLLALRNTDMLMQMALAPTARVRNMTDSAETDTGIYLGPTAAEDGPPNNNQDLYTVALSTAYIVNSSYTGFQYATFDSPSSGQVDYYNDLISTEFSFDTWDSFYLYPGSSRDGIGGNDNDPTAIISGMTVLGDTNSPPAPDSTRNMPLPFGGDPAGAYVVQVTASSSADAGKISPLLPSVFAQTFSATRASIRANGTSVANQGRLAAFDIAVAALYNNPLLDKLAVCAQWPSPCGTTDGQLLDGGFVDNPSVAINVAQYHQRENANLTKTMKMVLTNTNGDFIQNSTGTQALILQYFDTDFNEGIDPGQYVWIPGSSMPRRSAQLFQESLSVDQLVASLVPIQDSNMSTAILKGTTIRNEAFGILEGQEVEILLLNLNEEIPTIIVGSASIIANTVPLAEMTQNIASNEELLRRIQDFFGTEQGPPGPGGPGGEPDLGSVEEVGDMDMDEVSASDGSGEADTSTNGTNAPIDVDAGEEGVDNGEASDNDSDSSEGSEAGSSAGSSETGSNNATSSSWMTASDGMWIVAAAVLYSAA